MNKLTKQQSLQVAEIAGAESFILIACDSKLPCSDMVEHDMCDGGHKMEFTVFGMNHSHTVSTLNNLVMQVMNQGIET